MTRKQAQSKKVRLFQDSREVPSFKRSTFWGNKVEWESESLELPTALSYQAAYFYILAVYFKTWGGSCSLICGNCCQDMQAYPGCQRVFFPLFAGTHSNASLELTEVVKYQ